MPSTLPAPKAPTDRHGLWAWWTLCLVLGLPALWVAQVSLNQADADWPALAQRWVLYPAAGLQQPPWVWWTSAWLHGSTAHLWGNLGGLLLLAWVGHSARADWVCALVWALCWPLAQLGLLWQPELQRFIGLSGVLHAGFTIVALHTLFGRAAPLPHWLGGVLLLGLVAKVLMENPGAPGLIPSPGWAITVAPWVHLCGVVAAATLMCLWQLGATLRKRRPRAGVHRTLI